MHAPKDSGFLNTTDKIADKACKTWLWSQFGGRRYQRTKCEYDDDILYLHEGTYHARLC